MSRNRDMTKYKRGCLSIISHILLQLAIVIIMSMKQHGKIHIRIMLEKKFYLCYHYYCKKNGMLGVSIKINKMKAILFGKLYYESFYNHFS